MHNLQIAVQVASVSMINNNNSRKMLASLLQNSINSGKLSPRQIARKSRRLQELQG